MIEGRLGGKLPGGNQVGGEGRGHFRETLVFTHRPFLCKQTSLCAKTPFPRKKKAFLDGNPLAGITCISVH
jgi:hypothetical protein